MNKSKDGSRAGGLSIGVLVFAAALGGLSGCAGDEPQPEPGLECIRSPGGDGQAAQELAGLNLAGTNLGGTNLGGVNLGGVNLGGVNLGGTNLGGVNLGGTNLGGTNLGGTNLGGNNLAGNNLKDTDLGAANLGGTDLCRAPLSGLVLAESKLGGSDVAGAFAGFGCPVDGTQNLGADLTLSTVGVDIHPLGGAGRMLYSGEDAFTRPQSCVVMGIGSTAMARLVDQNSKDTTMYAALGRLPWGFTSTAGGPVELRAWEVILWGSSRYSVFILAAPTKVTFPGVAGFVKALWRWTAPPTKTLEIGQIGGGMPVARHPGMMDAGAKVLEGTITEKDYLAGELTLVTATTNTESVLVDFTSWVRKSDGTGAMLANIETPSSPSYGEAVYVAMQETDGTLRIGIRPLPVKGGLIDSMNELKSAYAAWQNGDRPDKPAPRRCAGALLLNSLNNAETDWETKCDSGVAWSPHTAGTKGHTTWTEAGGAVAPYNDYMTIQSSGGEAYVTCRPTDIDPATNTCPPTSLLPVLSETFVHLWEPSFSGELLGTADQVSAGAFGTCARRSDGTLWCWGDNWVGGLGSAPYGLQEAYPSMQVTTLGADVADVSGGYYSACALNTDGSLRCWGRNDFGQLGIGTTTSTEETIQQVTPVQVSALGTEVVEVSGPAYHACARIADGTLRCWGANWYGQLGTGDTTDSPTPVPVSELGTGVVQVSVGLVHTCARRIDGTLRCWGLNAYGQLGDGTTTQRESPVPVPGLADVAEVASGGYHTCARISDGTVRCWGWNLNGQLGDGTTTDSPTPVQVTGLTDVAAIASGTVHACVLKTDGTVWCWGLNSSGQLGDGTMSDRLTPVQVVELETAAVEVTAGVEHTCARLTDGTIRCWGANAKGQLASGVWSYSAPVKLTALGNTVVQVATNLYHGCALRTDGTVLCWGMQSADITFQKSPGPQQVSGLTDVTELAAGAFFTCALRSDGTVWCWGGNIFGQFGDGTSTLSPSEPVPGITGVVEIVAGYFHACGRKMDGTVWCWGLNDVGYLGDGTGAESSTPVQVTSLGATVVELAASASEHTCARKNDGTVRCWGLNASGQLGDGTTTDRFAPVQVSGLTGVVEIATGYYHTCARKNDGTVLCWGRNSSGQLGDGTIIERLTPVPAISAGAGVAELAPGGRHTCVRKTDGTLRCWGANYYGQLGNGTQSTMIVSMPVQAAESVVQVAAGENSTCAVKTDGSLWCWGNNAYGTLGIGTWANTDTPKVALPW